MRRLLIWLISCVAILGGAYAVFASYFGPGAEVRAAFERYKLALVIGDRRTEASLVAPNVKEHFDRIRRHALRGDRATVAGLSYGDRMTIFSLRRAVEERLLTVETMRISDPQEYFAAARGALPMGDPSVGKWLLVLVLPVTPGEAWGIADPTGMAASSPQAVLMVLFGPFRFRFVKIDGRWLIDILPLLESSAGENEYYARQVDPTGNKFIFNMLKVSDPLVIERLWRPLE